jgi:hemoglobin
VADPTEDHRVTVYELVGGAEQFVELVERFYAAVEDDPPLRAVYPEDLEPGKRALAMFLTQYWGGPRTYAEERGHPRLRMRHAPFTVTPDGAARWARHMLDAVESMDWHPAATAALSEYVRRFTPSMVNTPDDVPPDDVDPLPSA